VQKRHALAARAVDAERISRPRAATRSCRSSLHLFLKLWSFVAWLISYFFLVSGRVYRKIKNSISVPSHSDAIFSLGPSLQALLENAFSPNQHFQDRGPERELNF
jgi:hypothetical protein